MLDPAVPVSAPDRSGAAALRLMARLDALSRFSDEPGALTRLFLSPSHRKAVDCLAGWCRDLGLAPRLDDAGTLTARLEGAAPDAPTLIVGSHIDTVRDGGRYDGALGVLAALTALEEIVADGDRLPFGVEIVAFGDEEGVRFPTTFAGSRALAGSFDRASLEGRDADQIALGEALKTFGCDPAAIGASARRPERTLGFIEVHIEQGPVLEAAGLPVGVVTAIAGATRLAVEVTGVAGHAGTVPPHLRRDALAATAQMITAIETVALDGRDLVATVGRIEARPGAVNVIPGMVRFTIDIRSPDDARRRDAVEEIGERLGAIAQKRGIRLAIATTHAADACPCDPGIVEQMAEAVARQGVAPLRLPSGAGHDAMAVAALCPVGMLFVRCKDGISHHPSESITSEDAGMAVRVLVDFIRHFRPVRAGRAIPGVRTR